MLLRALPARLGSTMSILKKAIELRKQVSKSSTAKLDSLLLRTSSDGRLRQNYRYYGAHTGRWSGEGVQPQNLPRGTVREDQFDAAVESVRSGGLLTPYGQPIEVISSTLRGAFRAPAGYTFIIVDLSQIEVRVLAWLTRCAGLLGVYSLGHKNCKCGECDVYISFGRRLYKTSTISRHQRQISKSAVLGCGFQLSGGEEKEDGNGDLVKTGLWGYAANMSIDMTRDEAHGAVKMYREQYWEVKKFWYAIEDACKLALMSPYTVPCGYISCGAIPNKLMWINLPAGRPLYYPRARLRDACWPDGRPKTEIRYYAVDPETKQFKSRPTYGGKLTENLCQAIARDVLAEGMLRIDEKYEQEIPIVGHTHDEVICLSEKSRADVNLERVEACLTTPMPWAPDLLLGASGVISDIYRK